MSIIFRRIRGHIVPIKVKDNQAVAQGLSAAAGGVAIAAGAGKLSATLLRDAAYTENHAHKLAFRYKSLKAAGLANGPLFAEGLRPVLRPLGEEALRTQIMSMQMLKASHGVAQLGQSLASAAIGYGTYRALAGHKDLQDKPITRAVIGTGAGVAAAFVIRGAFYKSIGRGGTTFARAASQAAKALIIRKFGG